MTFAQFVKNLHREESGQDLLEYALVLAAVLTAVVAGASNLATDIASALTTINHPHSSCGRLKLRAPVAQVAWRHSLQPRLAGLAAAASQQDRPCGSHCFALTQRIMRQRS